MKKDKIISAVSAVALAVSSLVPLSANAYEIVGDTKDIVGGMKCWIKQDENDHMGFSPRIILTTKTTTGFKNTITFTTADGSILTKADFPEYGGEESIYFDVTYEDGVHTMSFRSNVPFLYSSYLQAEKRARSLSLRKNIENVEVTLGDSIQYICNKYEIYVDKCFVYGITVPENVDYTLTAEDFEGMNINKIVQDGNNYTIYVNVDEEIQEDYLLSNAYVNNYLKLEGIQKQSGNFEIREVENFLEGGGDIGTVPADDAGDFNADGEIDVRDFFILSQFIAEVDKETINADQADVNRDGVADVSDLLAIAQYIVK